MQNKLTIEAGQMRAAIYLYAAGSIAAGIFDLIWRNFEPAHQPIQALSDHIPGREILACITGILLVLGGAAILRRRTLRAGASVLAILYFDFALFWLPRFYSAPHALGFHLGLMVGLLCGVAQQLILVAAGIILLTDGRGERPRALPVLRWIFGLSSILFGLGHLTGVSEVGAMVPKWMPFGGNFWAILTAIAFVLAGVAIISSVLDVVAARLLALMLFVFSVLVLAPTPFRQPNNHVAWGSNAYNLAAVGAVWIFAEWIASRREERAGEVSPEISLVARET